MPAPPGRRGYHGCVEANHAETRGPEGRAEPGEETGSDRMKTRETDDARHFIHTQPGERAVAQHQQVINAAETRMALRVHGEHPVPQHGIDRREEARHRHDGHDAEQEAV